MTTTLDRAGVRRLSAVGPNWYASVMATGIVANASVTLPVPGLHRFGLAVWLLAVLLLVVVTAATVAHWVWHPATARGHLRHPVLGTFYGAMPMALLTVGAGALLFGRDLVGLHAALVAAWTLWLVGTVGGVLCAVVVPRRAFTGDAFGGWLMPVVPPMVSAATGALLAAEMPAGTGRVTMLVACYALFGLALVASVVVLVPIGRRLLRHGAGPAALVPTLWIVLGPLGQSITAAHGLGEVAPGGRSFGVGYGLVAWVLAMSWLAVVVVVTVRARPPFGLPWWSFTFPVGTVVTGSSALAASTGLAVFAWSAVGLYAALVVTWVVVGTLTARNARRLLA